jgi:hypothetical protein
MIGILPYVAVVKELQNRFIPITAETIRGLNIFDTKSFISVLYRTLRCKFCGYVVEELSLMNPYERVTKRFATYVVELCECMTDL